MPLNNLTDTVPTTYAEMWNEKWLLYSNLTAIMFISIKMDLDLENEGELAMTQLKSTPSLESNSSGSSRSSIWVGHCIIREAQLSEESKIVSVKINLCQAASEFPKELLIGGIQRLSTLTIIHRPPIHR